MRVFKPVAAAAVVLSLLSACHQASPLVPVSPTERQAQAVGARSVSGRLLVKWKGKAAASKWLSRLGLSSAASVDDGATQAIDLPAGMSAEAFRRVAGEDLAFAEPDYYMQTFARAADPLAGSQYALKKVRAAEAWQVTTGAAKVKIAVIDTGADLGHPDLKRQIASSYNAIGWRGKVGMGSAKDENGHGTHCAGIAAAAANGEGILGMAPNCQLLVVKALGADGSGATSDIARGIHWAVKQGADVLSLSMGGTEDAAVLREAIKTALDAGVVVVAAMGNEGKTLKNYPAAYPGVIAVGSTTSGDKVSGFSTRGGWISVSAPGSNILSTTPTYRVFLNEAGGLEPLYGKLSGTSMATPLVAGLAGLLKSQHPSWTPAKVKQAIESSATALTKSFSTASGHGRIDAAAALRVK